jgi:hypothetical protein
MLGRWDNDLTEIISGERGVFTNMAPARNYWEDGDPKVGGAAIDFNTTDVEKIVFADFVLDTSRPWTIAWKCYMDDWTPSYPGLWQFNTDQGIGFCHFMQTGASYGPLSFGSSDATFDQYRVSDNSWSTSFPGNWTSFAITYAGGGRSTIGQYGFYRNGIGEAITTGNTFDAHTAETHFGYAQRDNNTTGWDGAFEYCNVWNRVLTDQELLGLHRDPMLPFYLRRARLPEPAAAAPPTNQSEMFLVL